MEQSLPLYRNVYRLVEKSTGEPLAKDVDFLSMMESQNTTQFNVERVNKRVPIIEQYEQMYRSVQKVPKTRNKRVNIQYSFEDTHSANSDKLSQDHGMTFSDRLDLFSKKTARQYFHGIIDVKPKNQVFTSNTSNRKKINLYDLKDGNQLLEKIKQRSPQGVFSDAQTQRANTIYSRDVTRSFDPHQNTFKSSTQQQATFKNIKTLAPLQPRLTQHQFGENKSANSQIQSQDNEVKKQIKEKLAVFQKYENIDMNRFSREDLKRFFQKMYPDLNVSELTAIEGIHFSRGKLMEKSNAFELEKLVEWLQIELPILQSASKINQKEKVVHKARFMTYEPAEIPQKEMVQVDDILKTVSMSKKAKTKLMNSLMILEQEVQEQRSQQGMLAQLAAQRRLIQRSKESSENRAREVQRQVRETCHYDSAVRAINLEHCMNESWSETKNSYKVVSMLNDRERRRLNQFSDRRGNFLSPN